MIHLLKSELFRMRRRPQSWLLIAIAALMVGLFYGGFAIGSFFASPANAVDLKNNLQFSEIRQFGLSFNSLFGGIMLVIVAAGLIGNEFSWNTIRPLLARARSRSAMLTAKFTTLLIYCIVFSVILAALTIAMSFVSSIVVGESWNFSAGALSDVLAYCVGLIYQNLPTMALAFLLALWTKSNAAGIGVALGLIILEPTLFAILRPVSDVFEKIQKGGLAYNSTKLLDVGLTEQAGWIAAVVIGVYTAIFVALSYIIFLRRDVTSG
jgi:ABC-2 type transport system permease protein